MDSSEEQTLCFVSWNISGEKKKKPLKENINHFSKKLKAEIFLLQETKIGSEKDMTLKKLNGWKSFLTVFDSESKGVAILIKDDVPFQYLRHDEDYSGGYLVLFCYLYGELFTLVNVYNHKYATEMLNRLQEYLRETAEGVLVVGGDFNTVLDLSCDRKSEKKETIFKHTPLWGPFKKFTASLNLMDTWAYFHPTVKAFTFRQGDSYSRLDMFLLREDNLDRIKEVKIKKAKRTEDQRKRVKKTVSRHLLLLICLKVNKVPNIVTQSEKLYEPDKRAGKINGAEILSVIKSLTDSGHTGPDRRTVQTYKNNCCLQTENLKEKYLNCLMEPNKLPPDFNASLSVSGGRKQFNVDYLIFTMILVKRINLLLEAFPEKRSQTNTCDLYYCVTFAEKPKKIKWTFLKRIFSHILKPAEKTQEESQEETQKKTKRKTHEQTLKELNNMKTIKILLKGIVPLETEENNILEVIMPKVSDDFRELQDGCPLTRCILSVVLKYLELQINEKYIARVCYSRQIVVIHEESSPDLTDLCEEFKNNGIELKCFQFEANVASLGSGDQAARLL